MRPHSSACPYVVPCCYEEGVDQERIRASKCDPGLLQLVSPVKPMLSFVADSQLAPATLFWRKFVGLWGRDYTKPKAFQLCKGQSFTSCSLSSSGKY